MVDHPAIVPIEVFDRLESTQTEALSRLRTGDYGPRWIQARTQTAGLGRKGPTWQSLAGNLFASWYQAIELDLRHMPQLAFVAALSVHDVLRPLVREAARLRIKWPNDVLYDGHKLCGILVQSTPLEAGQTGIVVGIGVNVTSAPKLEAYGTAAVNDIAQADVSADFLMTRLSHHFQIRFTQWQCGGFGDMAREWFAVAYGRDQKCIADEGLITGRMAGLNGDGALLIETESGVTQAVSSGTVRYQEVSCS